MSVDLVGSTAFKAKHGERREENEPYPIWLNRTKSFYRQFPHILATHFDEFSGVIAHSDEFKDRTPKVWKTVGDEIIFCIRVTCLEHLACCVRAFMKALSTYGDLINGQENELDVKGCAWIASFPAPNATVVSASRFALDEIKNSVGGQLDEEDETKADINPGEYDFLGKQIDTGFRISKFAQSHELAVSIDLAWLLTLLKQRDLVDCQFTYRGRESLKGVIGGVPYPIVTIQTERSVEKRELDTLERTVAGLSFAEPIGLRNYLHSFMEQHRIEVPIISLHQDEYDISKLPKCYTDLTVAWGAGAKEEIERTKLKEEADAFDDTQTVGPPLPAAVANIDEINVAIDRMVKDYWTKGKW